MHKIIQKRKIADRIFEIWVDAPHVARHAKAGQFAVLRIDEKGERIPLTISGIRGDNVRFIFLTVGKTTTELSLLGKGDGIRDVAGPLGKPTEIAKYGSCVVIGGGVGIASTPIIAKALKDSGNEVIGIIGARNEGLLLLENELRASCDELTVCTDDGSRGYHGFPADILKQLLTERPVQRIWIIGPAIMMKVTSEISRSYGVQTYVSLNPIMVDGTGMCGSCRVSVGGETKFACVDGPEFDAHLVNFDELIQRQRIYIEQESESMTLFHERQCKCDNGGRHD